MRVAQAARLFFSGLNQTCPWFGALSLSLPSLLCTVFRVTFYAMALRFIFLHKYIVNIFLDFWLNSLNSSFDKLMIHDSYYNSYSILNLISLVSFSSYSIPGSPGNGRFQMLMLLLWFDNKTVLQIMSALHSNYRAPTEGNWRMKRTCRRRRYVKLSCPLEWYTVNYRRQQQWNLSW